MEDVVHTFGWSINYVRFKILHSKLIRPEVSTASIARIDLENKLRDNRRADVILVSSFAGSGKTTVISEWISRCDYEHIWYSLDN